MRYFRLISIIAMALSTLRNHFRLIEENSISKFQDFYIEFYNENDLYVLLNYIGNYNSNNENIAPYIMYNIYKPNLTYFFSCVLLLLLC